MAFDELESRLGRAAAEGARHQDQALGIVACRLALEAARLGNYGVGAVLVDPTGAVVAQGGNAVFVPRFRSDLHAEMVVMNVFEDAHPQTGDMRGYTLLCSLEPCPMCLARLLTAGVQTVKFLAMDEHGGMVSRVDHLPAAWQRLRQRQEAGPADVSDGLRQLATDVFLQTLATCRERLLVR